MRTQREIDEMIELLLAKRDSMPSENAFGESNTDAYNLAISVLDGHWDHDDVYDRGEDQYVEDLGILAVDWLNCDVTDEELLD